MFNNKPRAAPIGNAYRRKCGKVTFIVSSFGNPDTKSNGRRFDFINAEKQGKGAKSSMTEDEKKLLQGKHRLEEALARDRSAKERKARTHRLIVEGAALEKVLPEIKTVETDNLEEFLHRHFTENLM